MLIEAREDGKTAAGEPECDFGACPHDGLAVDVGIVGAFDEVHCES